MERVKSDFYTNDRRMHNTQTKFIHLYGVVSVTHGESFQSFLCMRHFYLLSLHGTSCMRTQ